MSSFHAAVEQEFAAVNQMIVARLHSDVDLVENIGHYIVDGGGKRLRPVVALLTAMACGYRGDKHIAAAVIVEFIHTATLLHDDVVDLSTMRRGRKTANAEWGNAPSVLVGDFIYSRAFQMMVELGDLEIMQVMADATNIIAEGEVEQLVNAGNGKLAEPAYYSVIYKKTARLFEAAAELGGCISSATDQQRQALRDYGRHLGNAFQIVDDLLDYCGSEEAIGKSLGDDLAEGKMTLPLIYARDNGSDDQAALISEAIADKSAERFADIVGAVNSSGAVDYCRAAANDQVVKAKLALAALPDSQQKTVLAQLADFSIARSH